VKALSVASRLARRTPFFYGWAVLFAAGSSQFVRNAAASLTIAVFIYPMSEDLGWSRTLIAGAASLGGLAASGASPIVGWLSDRYGVRWVLAISILILGISTMSLRWATVPIAFYLAFGMGRVIFSSPVQIGSSVVISRWFVRMRGRATGILFLSHSAGMVLFPLMASFFIGYAGWQRAWLYLGAIVWIVALAPTALLVVQRPEDVGLLPDGDSDADKAATRGQRQTQTPQETEWTLKQAMRTPALWMLAVAAGGLFLVQAGTNTHIGAYFRDQQLGVAVAAAAISANAVFTGVGSLVWGWVTERIPVRFAFAAVAVVMAIASALLSTADTVPEALAYSGLFGMALGGILVVPPVAFADYFGRRSLGAIRGVTEPFTSLGQAIGALLSGAIFDITGSYVLAFITFAVVASAAVVLLLVTRPPVRRVEEQPVAA
jgi:sugar phosphate permease